MSKRQHVEYRTDSFVDYEGNVRKFIICAVSDVVIPVKSYIKDPECDCEKLGNITLTNVLQTTIEGDGSAIIEDNIIGDVVKVLSLGISIQNKNDIFNETIGKKVAYGRAVKKPYSQMFATTEGVINTPMVEAMLKQECAYFKQVPYLETWGIKGYAEAAKKYHDKHKNDVCVNKTITNE